MRTETQSADSTYRSSTLPLHVDGAEVGDSPVAHRTYPGIRAMRRAIAFIEANLGERLSLELLAREAGISRFHFARQFRQATGCSPMKYLMRERIERSKRLLTLGNISMCELATTLGFCDQSHFTRTFRRLTGQSPREYVRLRTRV